MEDDDRPHLNAFSQEYLDHLAERDEVPSAVEAGFAGPWKVERLPGGGFGVLRQWESREEGHVPEAIFESYEDALLLAAVLPGTGRDRLFHLERRGGPKGYAVESLSDEGLRALGTLRQFNPHLVEALHIAACLVRNPAALAALLRAAGPQVQEIVGELLVLEGDP